MRRMLPSGVDVPVRCPWDRRPSHHHPSRCREPSGPNCRSPPLWLAKGCGTSRMIRSEAGSHRARLRDRRTTAPALERLRSTTDGAPEGEPREDPRQPDARPTVGRANATQVVLRGRASRPVGETGGRSTGTSRGAATSEEDVAASGHVGGGGRRSPRWSRRGARAQERRRRERTLRCLSRRARIDRQALAAARDVHAPAPGHARAGVRAAVAAAHGVVLAGADLGARLAGPRGVAADARAVLGPRQSALERQGGDARVHGRAGADGARGAVGGGSRSRWFRRRRRRSRRGGRRWRPGRFRCGRRRRRGRRTPGGRRSRAPWCSPRGRRRPAGPRRRGRALAARGHADARVRRAAGVAVGAPVAAAHGVVLQRAGLGRAAQVPAVSQPAPAQYWARPQSALERHALGPASTPTSTPASTPGQARRAIVGRSGRQPR